MRKINKRLFIIVFSLFMCLTSFILIDNKDELKELFDPDSVVVNSQDNNGIKLAKYSTDGSSITVVATIDEDVTNRNVSWSLEWASSNSESVNNFVSISNSSDTLTCTITFKKAFTTTILLTCTYSENSSVKAVANIDYIGRDIETYYEHNYDFFVDWGKANMTFGKLFDYVEMDLVLGLCETVGGSTSAFIEYYFDDTIDFYISNSCVWQIDHTDSTQRAKTLSTIVGEYRAKYMAPVSTLWNLIYSDSVVGFKVSYDIFYDLDGYDYYMGSGTSIIYFKFPWQ